MGGSEIDKTDGEMEICFPITTPDATGSLTECGSYTACRDTSQMPENLFKNKTTKIKSLGPQKEFSAPTRYWNLRALPIYQRRTRTPLLNLSPDDNPAGRANQSQSATSFPQHQHPSHNTCIHQ